MTTDIRHRMSDKHEAFLTELLGLKRMPGSGNQAAKPMDARGDRYQRPWAWAVDGKATLGGSVIMTRAMWVKAMIQADGEHPLLALRFYNGPRLEVGLDLGIVDLHHLVELTEAYEAKVIECERLKAELEVPRG